MSQKCQLLKRRSPLPAPLQVCFPGSSGLLSPAGRRWGAGCGMFQGSWGLVLTWMFVRLCKALSATSDSVSSLQRVSKNQLPVSWLFLRGSSPGCACGERRPFAFYTDTLKQASFLLLSTLWESPRPQNPGSEARTGAFSLVSQSTGPDFGFSAVKSITNQLSTFHIPNFGWKLDLGWFLARPFAL